MPEAITKFAINSTLGTEEFKPLDKIVEENTQIKIQTKTFTFEDNFKTQTIRINFDETIVANKTIIIPVTQYTDEMLEKILSLSFVLTDDYISCTLRRNENDTRNLTCSYTVQIITFGGNVERG